MAAHSLTWQQPVMLCKQSHQDRNSGLFTQGSKGKGAIKLKGKGCLLFNILLGYENSRLFLVYIYLLSLTQSPQRSREKQILSKHRSLKDTYDGGDTKSYCKYYLLQTTLSICKRLHPHGLKISKVQITFSKIQLYGETLIQHGKAVNSWRCVSYFSMCKSMCVT